MAESHRGPASSRSGLSSFQAFPAVHEDDFRTRYEKRYSYDFTRFKKKKRNRRSKEASQDNNASANAAQSCQNPLLFEGNDLFQPTPISDAVLVIRHFHFSIFFCSNFPKGLTA